MPDQPRAAAARRDLLVEPSTLAADAARYVFAALVVTVVGGAAWWTGRPSTAPEEAREIDSAILVDLPSAEASSQPARDAAEGPEQQAARATVAQAAPRQQPVPPKPEETPTPESTALPIDQPPPLPTQPDPPAVLERKREAAPPPPAVAAPPTTALAERAPAGSVTPERSEADGDSEERRHASEHAITVWQRALLRRLQGAKRMLGASLPAGVVKIAFEIDDSGALASERISSGSGSPVLDKAALQLVRQAAPFPAPPPGSGRGDRYFIVPVRFR